VFAGAFERAHAIAPADIHSPDVIEKILKCLDLPPRAPPVSPAARECALPTNHFDLSRKSIVK
jgi:hypothetical protein